MSTRGSRAVGFCAILVCGCASAPAASRQTAGVPGASPAGESAASSPPPVAARPPGPPTRAEIDATIARGLGVFLQSVRLEPVVRAGRFVGFELRAADDLPLWQASGVDVRVGDVIIRVNGMRIERPEQAMWAFEQLRIARELRLDVLRGNTSVVVQSPIVDSAASPAR